MQGPTKYSSLSGWNDCPFCFPYFPVNLAPSSRRVTLADNPPVERRIGRINSLRGCSFRIHASGLGLYILQWEICNPCIKPSWNRLTGHEKGCCNLWGDSFGFLNCCFPGLDDRKDISSWCYLDLVFCIGWRPFWWTLPRTPGNLSRRYHPKPQLAYCLWVYRRSWLRTFGCTSIVSRCS